MPASRVWTSAPSVTIRVPWYPDSLSTLRWSCLRRDGPLPITMALFPGMGTSGSSPFASSAFASGGTKSVIVRPFSILIRL